VRRGSDHPFFAGTVKLAKSVPSQKRRKNIINRRRIGWMTYPEHPHRIARDTEKNKEG
jgi:hypothetical protein